MRHCSFSNASNENQSGPTLPPPPPPFPLPFPIELHGWLQPALLPGDPAADFAKVDLEGDSDVDVDGKLELDCDGNVVGGNIEVLLKKKEREAKSGDCPDLGSGNSTEVGCG